MFKTAVKNVHPQRLITGGIVVSSLKYQKISPHILLTISIVNLPFNSNYTSEVWGRRTSLKTILVAMLG